jgi:hypothetical protein
MKIQFVRSGGFGGIRQSFSASSESLPADEHERLNELIQTARFFDQPALIESSGAGVDRFKYRISVEGEQGNHTVDVDEAAIPQEMRPLITWLTSASKKQVSE